MEHGSRQAATIEPEVMFPVSIFTPQALVIASLSLAVLLVAIFVILSRRRLASRGNSVLLVGASDAGKTAILSTLVYKHTPQTHTSMQTNSVMMSVGNTTIRLIDIPGHPRIRDQFRDFLSDAKGIVFVVDSSTISRIGPAVAEYLHQILHAITSLPPSRSTPSLSIVAHKCDTLKPTAQATSEQLALNRVRTILERELEKRRASQAGGVGIEGLGAEETESDVGGLECSGNGEFRFANWEGGEVVFIGTSVSVGKGLSGTNEKDAQDSELLPLQEWLAAQL
ncbi:uncharacterized protein FIBRA_06911 [Fibroporia radiculosa]|uniref:Signal recognition particle receptor subunit beta n=1 Tax=Fibroporia radiculosa TaxID=599839 RepID=J4GCV4_9APHY|nr:uncharacterized protein FIBRA_06911 [Fibroporia radiculosa]CCM04723.1 predicted protein [Fibroporia radiculosa]